MTKRRWTVEGKAKIVVESRTMSASTVNICKKYGLSPNTFYSLREKFLEGGKAALAGSPSARTIKSHPEGERHAGLVQKSATKRS